MIAAYRTGVAGQAGIILVSLAYGANAAIWAAAYLLGPGFALGADSAVRLTEVTVGPLPTLPLLSGLPDGPMGAGGALLLAMPVVAGMFAGWLLTQRLVRGGAERAQATRMQAARVQAAQAARGRAGRRRAVPPGKPAPICRRGAWCSARPCSPARSVVWCWARWPGCPAGRSAADGCPRSARCPGRSRLVATGVIAVSAAVGAAAARSFRR